MTDTPPPTDLEWPLLAALDHAAIVAVTDTAGRIVYANDRFCEISGYERAVLIGADHRLLNSGEHPPEFFRQMYRTIASGEVWRGTICNRRRTGERYWVDTTIYPAPGADHRPHAYVSIRVDVTQHKQAQHELETARAVAERTVQARERFLANMSHELRTPLTALIGFAEVLSRTDLGPEQQENLAAIQDSAEGMNNLVNDVLTLAQSQAGHAVITPKQTDIGALARSCVRMITPKALEKGLAIRCLVSPDVPAHGLIDPVRMRQVMINLPSNAVKFTDRGVVALSLDWIDDTLRCEVVDTGCGFLPEDKERLLAAFEQAVDDSGRYLEGAGLGLPICRGLVSAMGGSIDGDGLVGQGARFWFTTPCPAVAVEAPELPLHVRVGADVLVVEDSPEIQRLLNTVLSAAGHWVQIAANGQAGVDALRERPFDLCLMDLRMPVMGGEDAVRAIRADTDPRVRATPVLAVSAEADDGEQDRFRALGFDGAVAKPVSVGRLLKAVEDWRSRTAA